MKIELNENDERIKEFLSSDKVPLPPYQRNLSNYLMYHYIKDLKNNERENKGIENKESDLKKSEKRIQQDENVVNLKLHENYERTKEFLETETVPLPTYLRNLSNYIKVWNN